MREACDAQRARARAAGGAHDDTRAPRGDRRAGARGFLYTVSVVGTTGERERAAASASPRSSRGRRRAPRCRSRSASGSARPSRRAQAADAGADGVIVGTRLVRAAGESEDPAGAVGALVAELAAGLAATDRGRPARIPRGMGLILTVTAGLIVWIVLWALGAKGFDAFLLADGDHPRRRLAEDPLRLPARPSQLADRCARAGCGLAALAAAARVRLPGCAACVRQSPARPKRPATSSPSTPSLPLQGPVGGDLRSRSSTARSSRCRDAGGHVGPLQDRLRLARRRQPHDRAAGIPGVTASNAKTAAQDTSTIAYLGDYNSAATAISLPLINAAGILQVSPASPYVGPDLLARRRPGRARTLLPERQAHLRAPAARRPGAGRGAGAADARAGRAQACTCSTTRTRSRCRSPQMVAADAEQRGHRARRRTTASPRAPATTFTGEVEKIARQRRRRPCSSPVAATPGTVALWRALHRADPHLLLLGSSAMVERSVHLGDRRGGGRART